MTENPFQRVRTRWFLLRLLVMFMVLGLILAGSRDLGHTLDHATEGNVIALALYLCMSLWTYRLFRKHGIDLHQFFPRGANSRWLELFGIALVLFVFAIGALWIVYVPLSHINPGLVESLLSDDDFVSAADSQFPIINRFLETIELVLIAPIVEEIVFRGILLSRWATKWGMNAGIIVSSVAFAVLHVDILGAFAFGMAMAILYLKRRTLVAPIIVHIMNNSFVVLIQAWSSHDSGSSVDHLRSSIPFGLICFITTLPLVIVFMWRRWPSKGFETPYTSRLGFRPPDSNEPDEAPAPTETQTAVEHLSTQPFQPDHNED